MSRPPSIEGGRLAIVRTDLAALRSAAELCKALADQQEWLLLSLAATQAWIGLNAILDELRRAGGRPRAAGPARFDVDDDEP